MPPGGAVGSLTVHASCAFGAVMAVGCLINTRLRVLGLVTVAALGSGCQHSSESAAELVYSKHGTSNGDVVKPRAIAIDKNDYVYVVDFTARIQVFDRDGHYLTGWTTPTSLNGRPSGISITPKGKVLLSDSHYHCLRIYEPYSRSEE